MFDPDRMFSQLALRPLHNRQPFLHRRCLGFFGILPKALVFLHVKLPQIEIGFVELLKSQSDTCII